MYVGDGAVRYVGAIRCCYDGPVMEESCQK